jgi:hypothetical protein
MAVLATPAFCRANADREGSGREDRCETQFARCHQDGLGGAAGCIFRCRENRRRTSCMRPIAAVRFVERIPSWLLISDGWISGSLSAAKTRPAFSRTAPGAARIKPAAATPCARSPRILRKDRRSGGRACMGQLIRISTCTNSVSTASYALPKIESAPIDDAGIDWLADAETKISLAVLSARGGHFKSTSQALPTRPSGRHVGQRTSS